MEMDSKVFEAISGREAISKLMDGKHVFNSTGHTYYMKGDVLFFYFGSESNGSESTAFFNDITQQTWYVQKPFDVRAEMLARPNEWVGAFLSRGIWCKVRFNSEEMLAEEMTMGGDTVTMRARMDELDRCIPIEDVPKGASL
ncbi:hypothetical protein [Exiguobacterium oxidotolerans]|uniref:hypothetical protein n=1 Tax=Exiguobacterium oxidotolerans TaxID=223958 RepID=UPI000494A7A0|nr:hypothetical protein [Exiguobacterium oxidotolerans]